MKYFMYNTLGLSLLQLTCCNKLDDINGHWHVCKFDQSSFYLAMDISNDTLCYLGLNSIHKEIGGEHNQFKKSLKFPGECGYFHFDYNLNGDTLFLRNYLENRYAIRCDRSCCDRVEELKKDFKLDIDLPKPCDLSIENKLINLDKEFHNIYIGRENGKFSDICYPGTRFQLDDKISTAEDVPFWIQELEHRNHLRLNNLSFRLICDENTLISEIKAVTNPLFDKGIRNIFLMFLNEDYLGDTSSIEYLRIDSEFLSSQNEYESLADFLKC